MEKLKSKEFWDAAAASALWTVCETFLGIVSVSTLLEEIDWHVVISA